uniref:DENN domain-containing protein 5A n=1 Tax=Acrobeloides nanus TaxID=290746 RepID=A0A914ELA0_9BILA
MGLCYDDNIPDQIYQSNICILDIDTGKLDLPEDVPPFPRHRQLATEIVSIIDKMNESLDENSAHHQTLLNQEAKTYLQGLKFNNAIRELILYHFGCLFHNYESFLISDTLGQDSLDGYTSNRDSVVNFDKASFLSDQADSYLPFLAAFLETQMFTSFVDSKILSQWQKPDENIVLFDQKLVVLREKLGVVNTTRTPIIDNPPEFIFSDQLRSPWKEKRQKQRMNIFEDSTNRLMSPQKKLQTLENDDTDSPKKIAHQNWKFVEQLLKETKTKTKRMLVVKMGKEAVHLGHNDLGITGVEENTLVAGFCDLLERVWAHGLKKKQGKSAFWMHVLSHQEKEKNTETLKIPDNASNMSPAMYQYQEEENVSGLSELLESVRQEISNIAKSYEQAASASSENQDDSNNWSRSLLRAANFIADKLNTTTSSNKPVHINPETSSMDKNGNTNSEAWPPAPPPRRSRISATPGPSMDVNKNMDRPPVHRGRTEASIQGAYAQRSSSTQGRSRLMKVPSFSDFSPNWSAGNGNSSNDPSGTGPSIPLHRHRAVSHERKRSLSRPRSPVEYEKQLTPLSTHISYDLKNILRMTEIKTDIGFARAFVRLALERKLLYKHLKAVLSNTNLLQKMYKRYAFLRCEEEREQFLYHILSLNAVDFSCFTHTFISTKMQYEVLLVAGIDRYHASSIWVMITGSLGSTNNISLPTNSLQFTFDHKNLGVLSTMRIGHILREKDKNPSKWFLDYVLVRNNITGQTFRFNCGRWFGRGVDDGALERLLVADVLPRLNDMDPEGGMPSFGSTSSFGGLISRPESPVSSVLSSRGYSTSSLTRRPRRSPSVGRSNEISSSKGTTPRISELQHLLGAAVNALVKHFFTDKDYRGGAQLTPLLCGENGLVPCLEQVFSLGRQDSLFSNRFFRQPYPWDYIEKVFAWFANFFRNGESRKLTREQRHLIIYAYNLVVRISAHSAVGKEGKFNVFILLTLRDRILSGLLPLLAWTPVTAQMYDESAFLRQPHHLSYLSKLL